MASLCCGMDGSSAPVEVESHSPGAAGRREGHRDAFVANEENSRDEVVLHDDGTHQGWSDPEKEETKNVKEGASPIAVLKRGLSNFSAGSAKSGKSTPSQPSQGSSTKDDPTGRPHGSAAGMAVWSKLFDRQANTAPPPSTLRGDERMIIFGEASKCGVAYPNELNAKKGGRPNRLRTAHFTPLTWLPKSLYGQFRRIANVYFLFISIIVFNEWSPKSWPAKVLSFMFVLLWTALKDLYEDVRRRRDDDLENNQRCLRLKRGSSNDQDDGFEEITWAQVLVGDVLYIPQDAAFPADMLLLHPAGEEEAYISTVMLDGETSLKNRLAPGLCQAVSKKCAVDSPDEWRDCQAMEPVNGEPFPMKKLKQQLLHFVQGLRRPGIEVKICPPTPVLSDVRGFLQIQGNTEDSMVSPYSDENFLPRGCVLRSTTWILGCVVYTGGDTKTRLNASISHMKFSNMQVNLNYCVWGLLAALFSVCIYATIMVISGVGVEKDPEVETENHHFLIRFLMFCILFYHVVPMSLYVVYEMLKLILAYQIQTDKGMYDPEREMYAQARTAEIIEEAGQVNFLFSDKTGTLTRNEMVFARCHAAGQDLGEFRPTPDGTPGEGLQKVKAILAGGKDSDPLFEPLLNLFTCLAVCHSVQVTHKDKDGNPTQPNYNGMSPDEVSLVEAARDVGSVFFSRVRKHAGVISEVTLKGPGDTERRFGVLHDLAFSSDRKRMSVIVKHKGNIWIITKGADSVMEGLLANPLSQAGLDDVSTFSRQGLRTLVVGMRMISKEEFEAWNSDYSVARNVIDETKTKQMDEVAARIEQGLKFIGITAVEDRLQDGVPEAISTIKEAGIRLWVLTGDKTETAVDIARSCNLFSPSTQMAYACQAEDGPSAETKLLQAHSTLDGHTDTGLVLDGQTLLNALQNPECREIIYSLGMVARSCICARLSPMQKLELVRLVRQQDPRAITLAVGDGANDVPMIEGAHLGVAIRGKEGNQAVQASDIAISYFRFLVPLLLCHGRRAYRRIAVFLLFYLYKNVALLMSDIIWMHQDKFQARIAFPEYLSVGSNVLYSAWHIIFVVGLDRDISDEVACARPELYHVGPKRALFNARIFTWWMLQGVLQGSLMWMLPYIIMGSSRDTYARTEPTDFWVGSLAAFTVINVVVNIKLVLHSPSPLRWTTVVPTIAAFLCYGGAVMALSYTSLGQNFQPSMTELPALLMANETALMAIGITTGVTIAFDVVERLLTYFVFPSELQKALRNVKRSTPAEAPEAR